MKFVTEIYDSKFMEVFLLILYSIIAFIHGVLSVDMMMSLKNSLKHI